jgi:hypothetical protein
MTGVVVVVQLLIADAGVTALVPPAQIVGDTVAQDTPLPNISAQQISSVDLNIPAPGATRHVTQRIQTTIRAASRPEAKAILKAVRRAGAAKMPLIAGVSDVVSQTDGEGPDGTEPETGARLQAQDFRVSYNEPA